ncbi:MAG: acetylornithine/N-succinyldiaminopimelate aminotransferase [Planctomycetota bacterium]|jgi:acetylornithine/N-succinyldiaminopimelate aminotransferase
MDEHLIKTYKPKADVFTGGSGVYLHDANGRHWMDLIGGLAVSALGHAHPRLVDALQTQAAELLHVSNLYRHPLTEAVSELLTGATGMAGVFFSNSGSEANECALKLARKAQLQRGKPERQHFVALDGGFHGRTLGSLSVTANPAYREPFGKLLESVFIEPENLDALNTALSANPAAMILEPIQGEGGLRTLSDDYLRAVRKACTDSGTILIHDEVQCGVGRTGTFLAAQSAGVQPDIVTLAKPLGAGLPMGATLACEELRAVLQPGDHGSTFGGGPMALCSAKVVLEELLQNGLAQRVLELGLYLTKRLEQIVATNDCATEHRGRGLMQGLVLPGIAADIASALHARGILACTAAGDVLRFLPPYIITESQLDEAMTVLEEILSNSTLPCSL